MFWTSERVERLHSLVALGKSGSAIAGELGTTRNTIIGKCHRVGLRLGPNPSRVSTKMARPPAAPKKRKLPKRRKGKKTRFDFTKARHDPAMQLKPWHPREVPFPDDMKAARGLGAVGAITTLKRSDCRWAIGDPRKPDFRFCGLDRQEGSLFCSHHHAYAYGYTGGEEDGDETPQED